MRARILIVDDSESFLASAARLLESEGFDIVGCVNSGQEAIGCADDARPDVALVDVEIGGESGFEVVRALSEMEHSVPSILISMYPEEDLADAIASSPALGFVAKDSLNAAAIRRLLPPGLTPRGR